MNFTSDIDTYDGFMYPNSEATMATIILKYSDRCYQAINNLEFHNQTFNHKKLLKFKDFYE